LIEVGAALPAGKMDKQSVKDHALLLFVILDAAPLGFDRLRMGLP